MSRLFRRSRQSKHILFRMLRWLIVYLCLAGALSGKGSASVRGGGGGSSSNTACTGCVSAEAVTQPHRRAPVMGIDLGTTYSVVGIWRNGGVEIVPNELGNRITPSVVAFSGGERFVGDGAKHMIDTDPRNTISAVKRLMGRAFADPQVQRDRANFPYGITAGPRGEAVVSVPSLPNRHMTPQEVSAMVLQKMRHIAEEYAGEEIRDAVITVPAYFNEAQRRATQEAGAIAGLNVLRILNEPTAAAVAYGLDERYRKDGGEKTVVVYDLGGGTFDVSLLSMSTEDDFFEVLATSGDTHLGGEDLDSRLAQHMLELFRKAHPGVAPGSSATARLRAACEAAKRQLTARDTAVVEVPGFAEGIDLSEGITRAKFEQLAGGLLKATLRPLEDVLSQAGLQRSDVDEVVLVGGSTRIPKVRSMVREFFKKEPTSGVNPDEAVAYGAAVHAAVLSGEAAVDVVVVNVSPLSLGIETSGGIMSPILPRNTQLPATQSKMFSTTQDNQQTVRVRVYEGERARSSDCRLLGEFELTGIAPAPRGVAQIQVVFAVDENGILTVAAEDKATGRQVQTTITSDRRSLSEEEVRALVAEAEAAAGHDKEVRAAASARAELEGAAFQLKQSLADEGGLGGRVGSAALQELRGVAQSAISWLDDNPDATPAQCAEILAEMQNAARSAVGEGAGPRMGDA